MLKNSICTPISVRYCDIAILKTDTAYIAFAA